MGSAWARQGTGCTTRTRLTCTARWSRRPRRRNRSASAGSVGERRSRERGGCPSCPEPLPARDPILLDLAVDILLPPLSTARGGDRLRLGFGLGAWLFARATHLAAHLAGQLAGAGFVRASWLVALGDGCAWARRSGCAPFYVAWKLWMRLRQPARPREWVRTAREAQPGRIVP